MSRAIPCFVSTPTSLVRYPSKRAALARAKVLGGAVLLECDCGCGQPASQPVFRAPPVADTPDRLTEQLAETSRWLDQARADGTPAADARRAMRTVRVNDRAAAEEVFGIRQVRP